jgi:hypothetical protein
VTERTTETICAEINAVQAKMESAEKRAADLRDTRKALVLELRETHPDSWLAELKERCQIGRSQAFKIAAIADGRTTEEKEREKNAAANQRYRNKSSPSRDGLEASVGAHQPGLIQKHEVVANPPNSRDADDAPAEATPARYEFAIHVSPLATLEALAADIMLLVEAVLRQCGFDAQQVRAELIRLLNEVQGADAAPIETARLDVDAATEARKAEHEAMEKAEAASPEPEPAKKRGRGRPPGSKNKTKPAPPTEALAPQ